MVSINNNSPIEKHPPERTPEEAALLMRLRIFGRLKWSFILGVILATLVASRVFHKVIKLKVELPPDLPKIRGSSPRLQQVMTNLVNNAIKYT